MPIAIDPTNAVLVVTSRPNHILRHDISDEELEMLCESKSDFVTEFIWVGLGGMLGSVPTTFVSLMGYSASTTALPATDLIQILIFFLSLGIVIVAAVVSINRGRRSKDLRTAIRDRSSGDARPT